jgi:hypothetical protein
MVTPVVLPSDSDSLAMRSRSSPPFSFVNAVQAVLTPRCAGGSSAAFFKSFISAFCSAAFFFSTCSGVRTRAVFAFLASAAAFFFAAFSFSATFFAAASVPVEAGFFALAFTARLTGRLGSPTAFFGRPAGMKRRGA